MQKKKKAVILDLVANSRSIEDIAFIRNLQKLYQQKVQSLGGQVGYVGGAYEIEEFDVIDYTEDFAKLLESLRYRTSEECLTDLLNFIKEEERLPIGKEKNFYNTLTRLRNGIYSEKYSDLIQEIENLCNELGIDLYTKIIPTSKECLINFLNFIKKEERLPLSRESNLYHTLMSLRSGKYGKEYSKLVQEIKDLCNELGINLCARAIQTSKECLINLLNFIKKEERLPLSKDKEINLYNTLMSLRNSKYDEKYSKLVQEIENLCNELGIGLYTRVKQTPKECLIDLLNFIKKEERLPFVKEFNLYHTLRSLRKNGYKKYPELVQEIKDLCNKLNLSLKSRKTK